MRAFAIPPILEEQQPLEAPQATKEVVEPLEQVESGLFSHTEHSGPFGPGTPEEDVWEYARRRDFSPCMRLVNRQEKLQHLLPDPPNLR